MGGFINEVCDKAAKFGDEVCDKAAKFGSGVLDVAGKLKSFDGLDKVGAVIGPILALIILKDGKEGYEGLQQLHDDFESLGRLPEAVAWVDVLIELRDKPYSELVKNINVKTIMAVSKRAIFSVVSFMTLNEYAARIGLPAITRVFTVITPLTDLTFSIGKVVGVAAMPLKVVFIITALSISIFENVSKLYKIYFVKAPKMNAKITMLNLTKEDLKDANNATVVRLNKRMTELREKIAGRFAALEVAEGVKKGLANELRPHSKAGDFINGDLENGDIPANGGAENDDILALYFALVKKAAILKLLNRAKLDVEGVEKLKNMDDARFRMQKLEVQYKGRQEDFNRAAFQAGVGIISTALKIATLGTVVGQAYLGIEVVRIFFRAETEAVYKIGVEVVKLVGAAISITNFMFFDVKERSERKPADFTIDAVA